MGCLLKIRRRFWQRRLLLLGQNESRNLRFVHTIDAQYVEDPEDLSEKQVYAESVSEILHLLVSYLVLQNQAGSRNHCIVLSSMLVIMKNFVDNKLCKIINVSIDLEIDKI